MSRSVREALADTGDCSALWAAVERSHHRRQRRRNEGDDGNGVRAGGISQPRCTGNSNDRGRRDAKGNMQATPEPGRRELRLRAVHCALLDAGKLGGDDRLRTLIGHVSSVGRATDAASLGLDVSATAQQSVQAGEPCLSQGAAIS